MHWPKDDRRMEMLVAPATEAALRSKIMVDVQAIYEQGVPLAAGWLRQLGLAAGIVQTAEAFELNKLVQQQQAAAGLSITKSRFSKRARERFEIECIVEQRKKEPQYLIRCAGYEFTAPLRSH